jgi:hypothetical protein
VAEERFPVDIAPSLVEHIARQLSPGIGRAVSRGLGPPTRVDELSEKVARRLFQEAISKGLVVPPGFTARYEKPTAGSTANVVLSSEFTIPFYIKIDNDRNVLQEAANLMSIWARADLPEAFKSCFPRVYAVTPDGPPFGYLMEAFSGYEGFEKKCFSSSSSQSDLERIADRVLDFLFSAYLESRNTLVRPNLNEIYLRRIDERLSYAASVDEGFSKLLEKETTINGEQFSPAGDYVEACRPFLDRLTPHFSTFVHGDPHPENIMVTITPSSIDLKLIDPKDWHFGDYLFDIGKLTHYLAVTGPVELSGRSPRLDIDIANRSIDYGFTLDSKVHGVIDKIVKRVGELAEKEFHDTHWMVRYTLSVASNLLGLPAGRLEKGKRESALVLFAEGLKYLKQALQLMGNNPD